MNKIKTLALGMLTAGAMISCSDSIDVRTVDEGVYESSDKTLAFITDQFGESNIDSIVFSGEGTTQFYVRLNKAQTGLTDYTIVYDLEALTRYNDANGTDYQPLPANLVTIEGTANVAAGEEKSAAVKVTYTSDEALETSGVYAIPLTVKTSGNAEVSGDKGDMVFLVRDITKLPDCHKENGLQVISCMEVNDANPLHNLCYVLENSGKLLIDQVILFSGNINYSEETGEVYNFNNENVQHLLDNHEKYLKPLKQKGMKVILGILGNHDRAGVANLSEIGAKKFAQELKAVLEAYDLDGVFFDDEYSSYGNYPGFVSPSSAAASRLCYECKQAMPDKLVEAYVYSRTSSLPAVDGHQSGEFVDYGIQDYGGYSDLSRNYPGMPKSGMIQASSEFAQGRIISSSTARRIVTDGYGGTMIFSLRPNNGYVSRMNIISQAFYGENTIQTGTYAKDW